jgi:PST family polysaccharide transporter
VQRSLFRRNLDFRRLFWVKLTTATIPGCFSIPLALYGYGVWALVAGYLAGSFMELVLLWWMSPWCPSFNLSLQQVKKIYGFSRWVFLESLTEWVFGSGDKIIVGKLIGINALGLYQVGCSIVFPLFSLILSFVLPVLYSTLSRLQDDNVSLTEVFNKMNRLVILVSVPMGVGLFLMGPQLASALFGDKWAGLGWTISLLGLAEGLGWPVSINHELFRAIGRPDLNPKLMLLVTSYYLPINLIGALYSLDAFLITRLVTSVIAIPIHGYLCSVILKISPLYLWQNGKTIIFASLAMASTVFVANILNSYYIDSNSNILSLAAITSIAIITYFGTLWIFDRQFIYQVKMLVKRSCLR